MACCFKAGFAVYGSTNHIAIQNIVKGSLPLKELNLALHLSDQKQAFKHLNVKSPKLDHGQGKSSICICKAMKWWDRSVQPNMIEIHSALELVDSLVNAGDRLVVVDFYAPGCGGCKSLYPKICQLAESNPNAIFLKVNYEEHKEMCCALRVHVLPFFRFYIGANGRVCSFSCTNATIKKFKDALAKHGAQRSLPGPAKGLDESEILALASIGLISKDLVPSLNKGKMEDFIRDGAAILKESEEKRREENNKIGMKEDNGMVMA